MKDHEIAQLVNALRDCAVEYRDSQQLRDRLGALIVPALRGERTAAEIGEHGIENSSCDCCFPITAEILRDHNAELATLRTEVNQLREELRVTDQLLAERNRLLKVVPACLTHGEECVSSAIEWVERQRSVRAALLRWMDELNGETARLLTPTKEVVDKLDDILLGGILLGGEDAAKAEASNPLFRRLSDDECAALTRAMWALDDSSRHSDVEYGRAWVNCVTAALQQPSAAVGAEAIALWASALFADAIQQNYSGITADGQNTSQVVDFGAAGPNRTGDLLITNQNKDTPETSQNQDVTPKTAPAQPAQVATTESNGCEGVTAGVAALQMPPCPFCGGPPVPIVTVYPHAGVVPAGRLPSTAPLSVEAYTFCHECGAEGPRVQNDDWLTYHEVTTEAECDELERKAAVLWSERHGRGAACYVAELAQYPRPAQVQP